MRKTTKESTFRLDIGNHNKIVEPHDKVQTRIIEQACKSQ